MPITPVIPIKTVKSYDPPERPTHAEPENLRGLRLVSFSEVLAALSYALDLTGGQPPGHTVRTCMIGMRIANTLGLSDDDCAALYDTVLLKDAGASSNLPCVAALCEPDEGLNSHAPTDGGRSGHSMPAASRWGGAIRSSWTRFMGARSNEETGRGMVRARSDRGAKAALRLGFPRATAHAIRSLEEHWDGCGLPEGKRGEEIPLMSRIANLAQTIEAFRWQKGLDYALGVVKARRGRWFEPRLVDVVMTWEQDAEWWASLDSADATAVLLALKPSNHVRLVNERGIDDVARAFADIIDAKSPFTYNHSTRVAEFACAIGDRAGLGPEAIRRLRRAALLHDVGKLGVPSAILDKPSPLTDRETTQMRLHAVHTWEILSRVAAFSDFARMAAMHHEKLDGSGYPWGLCGDDLDASTRILIVADIFEALTASRPYRAAMAPSVALGMIRREAGITICREAVQHLAGLVGESRTDMAV